MSQTEQSSSIAEEVNGNFKKTNGGCAKNDVKFWWCSSFSEKPFNIWKNDDAKFRWFSSSITEEDKPFCRCANGDAKPSWMTKNPESIEGLKKNTNGGSTKNDVKFWSSSSSITEEDKPFYILKNPSIKINCRCANGDTKPSWMTKNPESIKDDSTISYDQCYFNGLQVVTLIKGMTKAVMCATSNIGGKVSITSDAGKPENQVTTSTSSGSDRLSSSKHCQPHSEERRARWGGAGTIPFHVVHADLSVFTYQLNLELYNNYNMLERYAKMVIFGAGNVGVPVITYEDFFSNIRRPLRYCGWDEFTPRVMYGTP